MLNVLSFRNQRHKLSVVLTCSGLVGVACVRFKYLHIEFSLSALNLVIVKFVC